MKNKFQKFYPLFFGILLTAFTLYVLLDAFVIPRSYREVPDYSVQSQSSFGASGNTGSMQQPASGSSSPGGEDSVSVTESSYSDDNISIQITQYREYDTDIYVADIILSDAGYLKTAFASNIYGKNITQKTSVIAENNQAILAINGDYYGARNGYVIRNGVLYRDTSSDSAQEDLVIYADGSFEIVTEGTVSASELLDRGAQQVLSFGPGLLKNGEIAVEPDTEVDKAKNSNPRTAVGIFNNLHYVMVVADGRTEQSAGLSLYELAEFMQSLGVQTAYNLDGGGSSAMVFHGTVINRPTTNGSRITERKVSDIVYIG